MVKIEWDIKKEEKLWLGNSVKWDSWQTERQTITEQYTCIKAGIKGREERNTEGKNIDGERKEGK